ncbi:MAG TPA: hypothetical protein VJ438_01520 [Candidatus Nanoarchaeia archaeon]|nr:hypothetical protein [Candidatus Nanoarchaeia archaeon]
MDESEPIGKDGAYNHTDECYGISFPYVTDEQKKFANRIVKLLNYEDWQFIEKERRHD